MTAAAPPIPEMGESRYVTVDGRRMRYLECGEGDPILLIHGWIGSAENFHKWVPALSERRRMIMPDLPGFGESDPLPGPHSIAALATACEAFASALGLRLFDLGGLCLGATVALELARRDPERVRQLVLHTPIYARPALRPSFKAQIAILRQPVVFPSSGRWAPRAGSPISTAASSSAKPPTLTASSRTSTSTTRCAACRGPRWSGWWTPCARITRLAGGLGAAGPDDRGRQRQHG